MSIIKHVTLQKIVAHDFRYDPRKLGSFSLDSDYVRSLSLGAIRNVCEGPGLTLLGMSMGHKVPVLRPRYIETERAQTQLLLYSTLINCQSPLLCSQQHMTYTQISLHHLHT